jgi:hypothetical protein
VFVTDRLPPARSNRVISPALLRTVPVFTNVAAPKFACTAPPPVTSRTPAFSNDAPLCSTTAWLPSH